MKARANDAHEQLGERIERYFGIASYPARISSESRTWASATFTGERHRFIYQLSESTRSTIIDRLSTGMSEAEFDLPGHLVADIRISARDWRELTVEALTVEFS